MGPSCRWCPSKFRRPHDVEAHERRDHQYEFEVAQNPRFIGKGKLLRVCDTCFVRVGTSALDERLHGESDFHKKSVASVRGCARAVALPTRRSTVPNFQTA